MGLLARGQTTSGTPVYASHMESFRPQSVIQGDTDNSTTSATPATVSTPIAGNTPASGSAPTGLPLSGILNWTQITGVGNGPGQSTESANVGKFFATDPNDFHFQYSYDPSTGTFGYSDPYTGDYATASTISSAVSAFENKYANVPLATLQSFLSGAGPSAAAAATTPTTTTTAPATTNDTTGILDALPSILAALSPASDDTSGSSAPGSSDPQVVPVTQTTSGSSSGKIIAALVIIGALVFAIYWYEKHHHGAHAGAAA